MLGFIDYYFDYDSGGLLTRNSIFVKYIEEKRTKYYLKYLKTL